MVSGMHSPALRTRISNPRVAWKVSKSRGGGFQKLREDQLGIRTLPPSPPARRRVFRRFPNASPVARHRWIAKCLTLCNTGSSFSRTTVRMTEKKRMGRPRLPKGQARTVFSLRFSALERKAIESAAKRSGETVTQWVRRTLLGASLAVELMPLLQEAGPLF